MTAPSALAVTRAFLASEAALPDRHHGPKGRTRRFLADLGGCDVPVTHATLGDLDWALAGVARGLLDTDQAAAVLVSRWLGADTPAERQPAWVGVSEGPSGTFVVGMWLDLDVAKEEARDVADPDRLLSPWSESDGGWVCWSAPQADDGALWLQQCDLPA